MIKKNPMVSAIVAMSKNRVIGKNNQLPWHLPADLKHFKKTTLHHAIIMGRKTFEAIGKCLPERSNIILTRDAQYKVSGGIVVNSIHAAIEIGAETNDEVFIIGGANIYIQSLPIITKIYLTLVHHIFEGDTFFPELSSDEWQEIVREDHHADKENPYDYSFIEYVRII